MINGFDWGEAWRHGKSIAGDYARSGTAINDEAIIWALLCEAATVSKSYRLPPRQGYPTQSSWPDASDEVTMWQKISAYIKGELEELPEVDSRPPTPSAADISRADAVLTIWHHAVTLGRVRKQAVYLRACGAKTGKVTRVSGVTVTDLKNDKRRAVSEMLGHLRKKYFMAC